jgi:hypothetical protein
MKNKIQIYRHEHKLDALFGHGPADRLQVVLVGGAAEVREEDDLLGAHASDRVLLQVVQGHDDRVQPVALRVGRVSLGKIQKTCIGGML